MQHAIQADPFLAKGVTPWCYVNGSALLGDDAGHLTAETFCEKVLREASEEDMFDAFLSAISIKVRQIQAGQLSLNDLQKFVTGIAFEIGGAVEPGDLMIEEVNSGALIKELADVRRRMLS